MLSQKEKRIVQYLSQHRDRYVTSSELAGYLSCSDRTVRTYIKSILALSPQTVGAELISKQGYGYRFEVLDDQQFLDFVSDNALASTRESIDINDRHNYILNKLIFEQNKILFDDLMDQLYVSRSTLSADLKKIRRDLLKYDLSVESRSNRGIFVEGSEHDKRRFIMDYFFSGHFLKNLHQYVGDDFFNLPISFEELTIVVLDECRTADLKLSDFVIQNLVVHIALAIKRVKDGFDISPIDLDLEKGQTELVIARNILNRVQKITGIAFPKSETNYIALHLIAKGVKQDRQNSPDKADLIRQDLLNVLEKFDSQYGYHFSSDFTLIEGLLVHLEVLEERLRNHVHLDNPLLEDITSHYADAFELTKDVLGQMPVFAAYQLSDDEIAYVALHIMAAIERHKEDHKLNVLVICATGYGSAQMLKNRINNELNHLLNVVDLIGYYDIDDDKLQGIDVIISSIDLSNLVFTVPVFTVSVFLKDDEVAEIKKKIVNLRPSASRMAKWDGALPLEQVFDQFFSEDYFQIVEGTDKAKLLESMVHQFNDDEAYVAAMLNLLEQREGMSTVIFDERIAVPHPIKAIDKTHRIGLAIVRDGLVWDETYSTIKLVFLVSPSTCGNDGLDLLTARIVALTEDPEWTERLIASPDFETFKQIFLEEKG